MRFNAIFALPIEICMWGGGSALNTLCSPALASWMRNMLFLALALAIAEECVIQQTSLAPLVIQIRGESYARVFGVNYVYFLCAVLRKRVCCLVRCILPN